MLVRGDSREIDRASNDLHRCRDREKVGADHDPRDFANYYHLARCSLVRRDELRIQLEYSLRIGGRLPLTTADFEIPNFRSLRSPLLSEDKITLFTDHPADLSPVPECSPETSRNRCLLLINTPSGTERE